MNLTLKDLYELIKTGNNEIKQEISELKNSLGAEIAALKLKNDELLQENALLNKRIVEIERRSKKYNFIVYGLQGPEENTDTELLNTINNCLGINCVVGDFRDIHRIGTKTESAIRPVVAEVLRYSLKTAILHKSRSSANELKKLKIIFSQDYSKEDYLKRKFMSRQLKLAKISHPTATIKNNLLVLDDITYSYEELKEKDNPKNSSLEVPTDKNRKLQVSPSATDSNLKAKLRSYSKSTFWIVSFILGNGTTLFLAFL